MKLTDKTISNWEYQLEMNVIPNFLIQYQSDYINTNYLIQHFDKKI